MNNTKLKFLTFAIIIIIGITAIGFAVPQSFAFTTTQIIGSAGDGTHSLSGAFYITTDSSGNVFVSGIVSNNVFKITPGGSITQIIDFNGDGTHVLGTPFGLATDSSGNVFVSGNNSAFKITTHGVITQIIDPAGDGIHVLLEPRGIATDLSGNVFVTGFESNNVFKITHSGTITQILNSTGDGNHTNFGPYAIATDSSGNVFVSGQSSNVFKITPGGSITPILNFSGDGTHVFDGPGQIATDSSGNVFVSSSNNAFKITPGGSITQIIDSTGDGTHALSELFGIATGSSGNIFVTGLSSQNAFKITPGGSITQIIDSTGDGIHAISGAAGVATGLAGNVYVTGSSSNSTFKIAGADTTPTTIAGSVFNDVNNNGRQDNESAEIGIGNATLIAVDLANQNTVLHAISIPNGTYSFNDLSPGNTFLVQLTPVPTSHLPSNGTHSFVYETPSPGQNTINFSLLPINATNSATINGTIFNDTNNNRVQDSGENGLNNAQVLVVDFLTLTKKTVHTDVNGHFTITGVPPSVVLVQVAPVPGGFLPINGTQSFAYLPSLAQGSTTTVNFALHPILSTDLMTIHSRVFDDLNRNGVQDTGEPGIAGVQVISFVLLTGEQQNKFTNDTGDVTFNGITPDVTLVQEVNPPGTTPTTPIGTMGFKYFISPQVTAGANLTENFGVDSVVGEWNFENNITDTSGKRNNYTLYSGLRFVAGQVGQALECDGSIFVRIANNPTLNFGNTGSFSISLWEKSNQSGIGDTGFGWLVDHRRNNDGVYQGYSIGDRAGTIDARIRDGVANDVVVSSTTNVNDGRFHHVVFVVDRSNQTEKLFIDNTLQASAIIASVGSIDTNFDLNFCGTVSPDTQVNFFSGSLDQVRIYDTALSAIEVQTLFNER